MSRQGIFRVRIIHQPFNLAWISHRQRGIHLYSVMSQLFLQLKGSRFVTFDHPTQPTATQNHDFVESDRFDRFDLLFGMNHEDSFELSQNMTVPSNGYDPKGGESRRCDLTLITMLSCASNSRARVHPTQRSPNV
jgi:hypothetical protein